MTETTESITINGKFWSRVSHEVEEHVITAEAGGQLGSGFNCKVCRKHPGHAPFIPVCQFGEHSLGDVHPDMPLSKEEIVEWVRTFASLVVRIMGRKISDHRPDHKNGVQYPFAQLRGQQVNNVGSGWVGEVDGPFPGKCPCGVCLKTSAGQSRFWEVKIYTACHVVFDQMEAEEVNVVLFDEKQDGSGNEVLTGARVIESSLDGDYCWLACYTHDEHLAERVRELRIRRGDMRRRLDERFLSFSAGHFEKVPVFVVGHPHGRMKYITVGSFDARAGESMTYNVATCPGNSGGAVLPIGLNCGKGRWLVSHPHSGAVDQERGESASWSLRW